ncbi:hypothetical protein LTR04_001263 [Oleoguttula sp. CCFEE 6159]|nr:hypothetical protein LTR04_001263 [Oleoguttula sp. CCFEE 6159]
MDSYPISRNTRIDHLQILHNYLHTLSPSLTRLFFRWKGDKGPSPFALDSDLFYQTSHRDRTHPAMRRRRPRPPKFPKLKHMELENAVMEAHQISAFIHTHRHTLTEVDFEDVQLSSGTWDDALTPLTQLTGSAKWKEKQEEVMDVPLILSPLNLAPGILARTAQEQKAEGERGGVTMSRWLSKGRKGRAVERAKEQLWECEEHMKRFLRLESRPQRLVKEKNGEPPAQLLLLFLALDDSAARPLAESVIETGGLAYAFPSSVAFDAISDSLKADDAERKDAIKKGGAVFAFTLKNKEGAQESWHIDLKEKGVVGKGAAPEGGKAGVTLILSDDDFSKLISGKANAQKLFMSGKLKVKGDVMKATKMEPILKKAQTKAKL